MAKNFNMNKMLKQAQKMQKDLLKAQQESKNTSVTASSGGGMVRVTMNGNMDVSELYIDPEAVDPSDVAMLQELILAAISQAKAQVEKKSQDSMEKISGGMNIPGML